MTTPGSWLRKRSKEGPGPISEVAAGAAALARVGGRGVPSSNGSSAKKRSSLPNGGTRGSKKRAAAVKTVDPEEEERLVEEALDYLNERQMIALKDLGIHSGSDILIDRSGERPSKVRVTTVGDFVANVQAGSEPAYAVLFLNEMFLMDVKQNAIFTWRENGTIPLSARMSEKKWHPNVLPEHVLKALGGHAAFVREGKILEIGCGRHPLSMDLVKSGDLKEVVCTDANLQLVDDLGNHMSAQSIEFVQANADWMPEQEDESYRLVVEKGLLDSLQSMPMITSQIVSEVHRVLEDGGLFLTVTNAGVLECVMRVDRLFRILKTVEKTGAPNVRLYLLGKRSDCGNGDSKNGLQPARPRQEKIKPADIFAAISSLTRSSPGLGTSMKEIRKYIVSNYQNKDPASLAVAVHKLIRHGKLQRMTKNTIGFKKSLKYSKTQTSNPRQGKDERRNISCLRRAIQYFWRW